MKVVKHTVLTIGFLMTCQMIFSQQEKEPVKPIVTKQLEVQPLELKSLAVKPNLIKPALTEVKPSKQLVLDTLRVEPLNTIQHFSLIRDKDSVILRNDR